MNLWEDPSNFKPCSKISHEVYACRPPSTTIVINRFEQADTVAKLDGRTFFTWQEIDTSHEVQNVVDGLLEEGKVYLVGGRTPYVICGTAGELHAIDEEKFFKRYTLEDGTPLSFSSFNLPTWIKVKTSPKPLRQWACFVPAKENGCIHTPWGITLQINDCNVPHGKGDFVIANDNDGNPDLSDLHVVNGLIFKSTYLNVGWEKCISKAPINISKSALPALW